MLAIFSVCLYAAAMASATISSDVQSLVQSHLSQRQGSDDEPGGKEDPSPKMKTYKLIYKSTHGADHACLTEIQFLDQTRQPMEARVQEMSSCYGCPVHCDGCQAQWGDPGKQFDMLYARGDNDAWSCTNSGSFVEGMGVNEPHVLFTLPQRPAKIVMQSPDIGDWIPREVLLLEYQPSDGTWESIAHAKDLPRETEVPFFVQYMGTTENPPKWPIDFSKCGGDSREPILVTPSVDPPSMSMSVADVKDLSLAFNGEFSFNNGHGVSIDGEFGSVAIGSTAYVIRQLSFNFGSNYVSPDGNPAEGEMHIVLQKVGSNGIFDLAVVDILLQLKEEGSKDEATRQFFLNLGLESIPQRGAPNLINRTFNVSAFQPHFKAGLVMMPNCSQYTPWFVMGLPAYITGSILKAFNDGPMPPTPAPTHINETLVNMTAEERASALFSAGYNSDGTPMIPKTAEEIAAEVQEELIKAGPVPTS